MAGNPHPSENPEKLFTQSTVYNKVPLDLRREVDRALITREPATYKAVFACFELKKFDVSYTSFYARRVCFQAALEARLWLPAAPTPAKELMSCRSLIARLPTLGAPPTGQLPHLARVGPGWLSKKLSCRYVRTKL